MRSPALFVSVVAFLLINSAALAASEQDRQACRDNNPDRSIAGCTRVIEDGGETTSNRAIAYFNRGNAYRGTRQYDRAIADYNQSIRLNPNDADFYNNRGIAHRNKNQFDRAIADYSEAIRLDATKVDAYTNRALAHEFAGRKADAIADYRKALLLDPSDQTAKDELKRLGAAPW